MIKQIYKNAAPVLKKKCTDVTEFGSELQSIVQDMKDTLASYPHGVGLAAPQIGITQNIILITDIPTEERFVVINPVVIEQSSELESGWEACLSYPGRKKEIKRPKYITVQGFDIDGNRVEYNPEGFQARLFLHEMDHLIGRCRVG
jgi:peptide deformylase